LSSRTDSSLRFLRIRPISPQNAHRFRSPIRNGANSMKDLVAVTVSSSSISETIRRKALALAQELSLPFCIPDTCSSRYLLVFTGDRLELALNPLTGNEAGFSPIFVDFLGGSAAYRHARNCTIRQPLAKAVGIRSGFRPEIFDATAGLGGDSFVLACLGCRVLMSERSPVITALLEDGLHRAAADPKTAEIIRSRMHLLHGDGAALLANLDHRPHTVYLDPMYPHTDKSALNRKEMRMLRDIVGDDLDADGLLAAALAHADSRVVVKRPKGADHLGAKPPSHQIKLKSSRFDVYLCPHVNVQRGMQ